MSMSARFLQETYGTKRPEDMSNEEGNYYDLGFLTGWDAALECLKKMQKREICQGQKNGEDA